MSYTINTDDVNVPHYVPHCEWGTASKINVLKNNMGSYGDKITEI